MVTTVASVLSEAPKVRVFISYSWGDPEHESWVRKLAEQLEQYNEIHVTWDGFDLDELSDKNQFMEQSLSDSDYVLVVTSLRYKDKANSRSGGVGIETYLATALHWDQLSVDKKSKIVVLMREEDSIPNYLKGKIYIDFSQDPRYPIAFSRLLKVIQGESRVSRPEKALPLAVDVNPYTFTRVEDVIRLNHKNRSAIVGREIGTDFSAGNRIKFELWETKSPSPAYFIALFNNINISQTIRRAIESLRTHSIKTKQITILRPSRGEKGFIQGIFSELLFDVEVFEFTYAQYIWDYCIDDDLKTSTGPSALPNYTDQALSYIDEYGTTVQEDFARDYLRSTLLNTPTPTAHILVATGGMGKSSLCAVLCQDLLANTENTIAVCFIQAEALREHSSQQGLGSVQIESVFELYSFYSKALGYTNVFDRTTFELAVLCGKLAVVIDGLDELVSLLQERLDLDRLLKSLETLHGEFGETRFLLTTRSTSLINDSVFKSMGLARYDLLGFTDENCGRYARRRFGGLTKSAELINKLNQNLSKINLHDDTGRILPFFVDIVATVVEDQFKTSDKTELLITDAETPYPSGNSLIDHIVYSVFRREELRHGIDIPIKEVMSHLSELVVEFGSFIPFHDFSQRLHLLYDTRAIDLQEKLALNPLLIRSGDNITLRYAFLAEYLSTIYLLDSIINHSTTREFIKCLGKLNSPESTEYRESRKFLSADLLGTVEHLKAIVNWLKPISSEAENSSKYSREEAQRAISGLLRLYISLNPQRITESTSAIKDLMGSTTDSSGNCVLDGIFLFGEFPILDLSRVTVINGRFSGYSNFPKCRFDSTKFLFTTFEGCGGPQAAHESIGSAYFDSSCKLGDLSETLRLAKDDKATEAATVEADAERFLHCFFKGSRFIDCKTLYMKFSNRAPGLTLETFDRLIHADYISVKVEKADETYYKISDRFAPSVYRFLMNAYIDGRMRAFIAFVK